MFSAEEAEKVNDNVSDFNVRLKNIVDQINNVSFVSVEDEFKGHEAYTSDPYLNGIMLSQAEDLKSIGPSHYSIHPNLKGQVI